MRISLAILFLLAITGTATSGPNGECTCRHEGGDVTEGQTACVKTAKGMQLALCDRFLNNTSWRFLDQPCPSAGLSSETPVTPGNG